MKTSEEYINLVRSLRTAQKTYFATFSNLPECKRLEGEVDHYPFDLDGWTDDLHELVSLVTEMRDLQRQFFALPRGDMKRKSVMIKSKQVEARVDKWKPGPAVIQAGLFK